MRDLLLRQLELSWGFAERFVLGEVDQALAVWEPSDNTVSVRRDRDRWVADCPDEEHSPLPDATIAWLLWHIEFWWANAADAVEGRPVRAPSEVSWSGSTARLVALHRRWVGLLETQDPDAMVTGLMPQPQPFSFVASWVNFELTKNLTEINQLKLQRANRS